MAKRKQAPAKRKKTRQTQAKGKAGGSRKGTTGSRKASSGSRKRAAGSRKAASGSKKRAASSRKRASGAKKRATSSRKRASGAKKRAASSRKTASGSKKRTAKSAKGTSASKKRPARSKKKAAGSSRKPAERTRKKAAGAARKKRAAETKKKAAASTPPRTRPRKKKPEGISIRELQDALDRAFDWLSGQSGYYAYLGRRASPRGAPELGRHLQGDIIARQGQDGSWGDGSLTATAESLWRLLELGLASDAPAVDRALDWMYARRDQPGSFGSGCSPARHEQRLCEHYLGGFFSPGPPDESLEITLTNGQTVTSDVGARLLASERALRSALRARPDNPKAAKSITGLRSLPLYLEYGGSFTPAVLVGALQALTWVPDPRPGELQAGLEALAGAQEKDGNWPNAEFFFVLETLIEVEQPSVPGMLRKALPKLLKSQLNDGSWGRRYSAGQTWIAVQVLERALENPVLRGA